MASHDSRRFASGGRVGWAEPASRNHCNSSDPTNQRRSVFRPERATHISPSLKEVWLSRVTPGIFFGE